MTSGQWVADVEVLAELDDTMWRYVLKVVAGLALLCVSIYPIRGTAQPDSVRAAILTQKGFSPTHSPRGALWRSAAVPGWGQLYNRQYYKIPFVYAGLGALGYTAYQAEDAYRLFRRAALFKNEQNPRPEFRSEYIQALQEATGCRTEQACLSRPLTARQLRQQRDELRRRRNLAIIGAGVFYALTILDAYVSAHLLTFDVGDDLAIRVTPSTGVGPSADAGSARPLGGSTRSASLFDPQRMGMHLQVQF